MNSEEFEDLIIAESLGTATAQELMLIESLVNSNPELKAMRDEYAPVREALTHLAPAQEVPTALKSKIFAEISSKQANTYRVPLEAAHDAGWSWRSVLAAACIILFAGLGIFSIRQAPAPVLVQDLRVIKTDYILLKPPVAGNPAVAQVQWNGTRRAWNLEATGLVPLPANKDYQVWVIDPSLPAPVSCGVVKPDAEGRIKVEIRPELPVTQMKAFAISIEDAGGEKTPRGDIFLIGS